MKGNMKAALFVVASALLITTPPPGLQDIQLTYAADYAFQVSGGPSTAADISEDGRYVVFQSVANDLVDNDTNGVQDIFVHDRDADDNGVLDEQDKPGGVSTIRISVASDGTPAAGGDSTNPAISDDGRFVVFQSNANNLVANDTNGVRDIFVHDRDVNNDGTLDVPGDMATIRVSVKSDGTPAAGGHSTNPAISDDGQYIAYQSNAHNLVDNDTNGVQDIFVHDRDVNNDGTFDVPGDMATIRISVDSSGNPADGGDSTNPDISDDGRYIVFQSYAHNLLGPGIDTNGVQDIFLHDTDTGSTTRVSIDSSGNPAAGGDSTNPDISADGHYVVFQSIAHNLVNGKDDPGIQDIFVHDRDADEDGVLDEQMQLGAIATFLMNVDSNGNPAAGGNSTNPDISANGRHVAFQSISQSLVDNDDNGLLDIFVHDRDVHDDGTFDESGDIDTVRISVRTVALSSSGGTLTTASPSGGSGGGGSCFISATGNESSVFFPWLLPFVILGTAALLPWRLLKNPASHKK